MRKQCIPGPLLSFVGPGNEAGGGGGVLAKIPAARTCRLKWGGD